MKGLLKFLGTLLLIAAVGATCSYVVDRAFDMPQVHVSYSSGKCVRVDDPAAADEGREPYTCESLPETYEAIWVR